MSFIADVLTFVLVLNCIALMLLVLVQLPKKDAGAGLAFGGGAADALFGAGSGNALTKITKWATVAFVLITIGLSAVEVKIHNGGSSAFEQGVEQQQQDMQKPQMAPATTQNPATAPGSSTAPAGMSLFSATNTPAPAPAAVTTTNGK